MHSCQCAFLGSEPMTLRVSLAKSSHFNRNLMEMTGFHQRNIEVHGSAPRDVIGSFVWGWNTTFLRLNVISVWVVLHASLHYWQWTFVCQQNFTEMSAMWQDLTVWVFHSHLQLKINVFRSPGATGKSWQNFKLMFKNFNIIKCLKYLKTNILEKQELRYNLMWLITFKMQWLN